MSLKLGSIQYLQRVSGCDGVTHPSAQPGEQALIVQGPQGVELLHGCDQGLHGRGVHEVEGQQVVDAHGLRKGQEDSYGEDTGDGTLSLRHVGPWS